jgi:hypothetical protein
MSCLGCAVDLTLGHISSHLASFFCDSLNMKEELEIGADHTCWDVFRNHSLKIHFMLSGAILGFSNYHFKSRRGAGGRNGPNNVCTYE